MESFELQYRQEDRKRKIWICSCGVIKVDGCNFCLEEDRHGPSQVIANGEPDNGRDQAPIVYELSKYPQAIWLLQIGKLSLPHLRICGR
jgi:hypothetical protein